MRKPVILITGANGEMGHGLIKALSEKGQPYILALDLETLSATYSGCVFESIRGDILDQKMLDMINTEYEISAVYHLAALLSTRAEFSPLIAHDVNVNGTLNLLNLAMQQAKSQGKRVKFFFPSSIAVYGMDSLDEKNSAGAIKESTYLTPKTMYGCNKLYCEQLGAYFSRNYQQLSAAYSPDQLDFRSIRFPGLISAMTMPTGGTSDFIPEMIHNAVMNKPYDCFVDADTQMPFMTMPDAIDAILKLVESPRDQLSRKVYHITAFAPTADEFKAKTKDYIPGVSIGYNINESRQKIVNTWPANVDDSAAQNDWGWKPVHDFESAFSDYLIPGLKEFYQIQD